MGNQDAVSAENHGFALIMTFFLTGAASYVNFYAGC